MASQIPLPLPVILESRHHPDRIGPEAELCAIQRDWLDLKSQFRDLLEPVAARHGISHHEISASINGYVDDMLSDFFYEAKSRLEHEIEDHNPA